MESLEMTDSQWGDVLFSLRATARRDSAMAEYLGPIMAARFRRRSARLLALATELESTDEYGRRYTWAPVSMRESI